MSWITPTETWADSDTPTPSDFNRIEGNTDYLKDAVDSNDSDIASSASAIASNASSIASNTSGLASSGSSITVLNGTGTPQGVGTTNDVKFHTGEFTAGVDIGIGSNIKAARSTGITNGSGIYNYTVPTGATIISAMALVYTGVGNLYSISSVVALTYESATQIITASTGFNNRSISISILYY